MAAQRRGADTVAQSPHLQLTGTEVLWFKPGAVFACTLVIKLFDCLTVLLFVTVVLWYSDTLALLFCFTV